VRSSSATRWGSHLHHEESAACGAGDGVVAAWVAAEGFSRRAAAGGEDGFGATWVTSRSPISMCPPSTRCRPASIGSRRGFPQREALEDEALTVGDVEVVQGRPFGAGVDTGRFVDQDLCHGHFPERA
jgi:hypothetical protein